MKKEMCIWSFFKTQVFEVESEGLGFTLTEHCPVSSRTSWITLSPAGILFSWFTWNSFSASLSFVNGWTRWTALD